MLVSRIVGFVCVFATLYSGGLELSHTFPHADSPPPKSFPYDTNSTRIAHIFQAYRVRILGYRYSTICYYTSEKLLLSNVVSYVGG